MENITRVVNHFQNNPAIQFQYTYRHSFSSIAQAYLSKFNWESNHHYTTYAHVEQTNDDELVLFRR